MTGTARTASRMVRLAATRLPQYRPDLGPASGAAKIAMPVRATIAGCPPNRALTTEPRPTTTVATSTGTRYPCAIRNPMPCTLPIPIVRISIGNEIATMAGTENEIAGTCRTGKSHCTGASASAPVK